MSGFKDWRLGSKLLTGAAVSLLLSIGLCGMGLTIGFTGTPVQEAEANAGLALLGLSVILFFAAILALIFRDKDR